MRAQRPRGDVLVVHPHLPRPETSRVAVQLHTHARTHRGAVPRQPSISVAEAAAISILYSIVS